MLSLKNVLRSYAVVPASLGRSRATQRTADALARDLKRASESNRIYFTLCFGAVLIVFLGAASIAVKYLDSPQRITAIFSALGITVTGLIVQMTSLWKQKVAADTMMVLCTVADDEQIHKVIDRLLKTL